MRTVAYIAAVLVVFIVTVEVILSSTHVFGARRSWTDPDPLIGWRFKANANYWFHDENDHAITGRINNHGWRDRNRTLEKRPGRFRVAVLGDSFVEGLQVELDSTFVAIAERRLNDTFEFPVELLNFGRSGMTQSEELLVLQHDILPFDPDMVVLLFLPINDIEEVSPATSGNHLRPFYYLQDDGSLTLDTSFIERRSFRLKRFINPLKQHSALVSLGVERYNRFLLTRSRARLSPPSTDRIDGTMSLCTDRPDPIFAANYRLNKRLIAEIASVCAQNDIRFMLACTDWRYIEKAIDDERDLDGTFDPRFFERDMAALADSLGADYLGLQTIFEQHYTENGRPLHWQHWNYEGHRVAARALADALQPIVAAP